MVRMIVGVVVGMLVVGVVVGSLQMLSASFHPLPEGLDVFDPGSTDALAEHVAAMPGISWAITFGSEILGGFLGALAAGWIARSHVRVASGIIVGLAVLGSVNNWTTFEHPTWFMAGQLIAYPVALMVAWALLARRVPTEEEAAPA